MRPASGAVPVNLNTSNKENEDGPRAKRRRIRDDSVDSSDLIISIQFGKEGLETLPSKSQFCLDALKQNIDKNQDGIFIRIPSTIDASAARKFFESLCTSSANVPSLQTMDETIAFGQLLEYFNVDREHICADRIYSSYERKINSHDFWPKSSFENFQIWLKAAKFLHAKYFEKLKDSIPEGQQFSNRVRLGVPYILDLQTYFLRFWQSGLDLSASQLAILVIASTDESTWAAPMQAVMSEIFTKAEVNSEFADVLEFLRAKIDWLATGFFYNLDPKILDQKTLVNLATEKQSRIYKDLDDVPTRHNLVESMHKVFTDLSDENRNKVCGKLIANLTEHGLGHNFIARFLANWTPQQPLPLMYRMFLDASLHEEPSAYRSSVKELLALIKLEKSNAKVLWFGAMEHYLLPKRDGSSISKLEESEGTCSACYEEKKLIAWPGRSEVAACKDCCKTGVELGEDQKLKGALTLDIMIQIGIHEPGFIASRLGNLLEGRVGKDSKDLVWVNCRNTACDGGLLAEPLEDSVVCGLCDKSIIRSLKETDLNYIELLIHGVEIFPDDENNGEGVTRECYHCGQAIEKGPACAHMDCKNPPEGSDPKWNFVSGETFHMDVMYYTKEKRAQSWQQYIPRKMGLLGQLGFWGDPDTYSERAGKRLTKEEFDTYTANWKEKLAALRELKEQSGGELNLPSESSSAVNDPQANGGNMGPNAVAESQPIPDQQVFQAPGLAQWIRIQGEDGVSYVGEVTAVDEGRIHLQAIVDDEGNVQAVDFPIGTHWELFGT